MEDELEKFAMLKQSRSVFQKTAVPIPIELPPPPDLSNLPMHILHSGTVETLIGQNDDLMARLRVNLRRNCALEQQIMELERISSELQRTNSSLLSQFQVIEEKDHLWKEKLSRGEALNSELKQDIAQLSKKLETAAIEIDSHKASARYQRRIRRWVIPLIDRIKFELAGEKKASSVKDATISDLRSRLSETVLHSQELEGRYQRDQARLVEGYEKTQSALATENEKLRHEVKLLRERANRMESAVVTATAAENRIVYLERMNADLTSNFDAAQMKHHTLEADLRSAHAELDQLRDFAQEHTETVRRLEDQLTTLQSVWAESQARLETAKLQHESLNRLNQELSRKLRETRDSGQGNEPPLNC